MRTCLCHFHTDYLMSKELDNIIDIDGAGRAYGTPPACATPGTPLIALFDFAAAFPSVAHAWIWEALDALKLPPGLVALLQAVYEANVA